MNSKYEETMKDLSSVNQDYNLWLLLQQVGHAASAARQKELNQYSISNAQVDVLFVIQAIGNKATPAEISRWVFREPHSVSGLLNRMEREGLVRKVKDLDRKNLVRVAITEKGHQVYRQSTKIESIRKVLSSLSKEEQQQLMSCLETLRDKALEELGVKSKPSFPQF